MPGTHTGNKQTQARIFHLLLAEQSLTRQEIAEMLHLSMPTALQNITELLQLGLLEECGVIQSTGGRKAKKICIRAQAGKTIGIDIALHHTELVMTDLKGTVLCQKQLPMVFRDEPSWYQQLREQLMRFLAENQQDSAQILSTGISFPGIVDEAAGQISRSHVLSLQNVSLDWFKKYIPFPVVVANDANCAAFAEQSPTRCDYVYLSLNESVGGAIVKNGQLYLGDTCQAGEIGHMLLIPGGKQCYCGKYGCADAYVSPNALTTWGQTVGDFFVELQSGSQRAQTAWNEYLDHLAVLITNLHMLFNAHIILGGAVGGYMEPYLPQLLKIAENYDHFVREIDYIDVCRVKTCACAAGAAKLALQKYYMRLFA